LDPGTTTAIAILDMRGNVLWVGSGKFYGREKIVNKILEFGRPLVVATDRRIPPAVVEKIAASFDSLLYVPEHELSKTEKDETVGRFRTSNRHERDALASALRAYRKYNQLFRKIELVLSEMGLSHLEENVKEMVLKRRAGNIARAVSLLTCKN